jgi:putative hydrolase of the HAD superfamily
VRCFAFDLGRVIFDFDYTIALEKIKGSLGVELERVISALFNQDFGLDFEKGLISSYDFYEKFVKAFKATLDYEQFIEIWCDIFHPKEEVISLIEELASLYPVYLISNINQAHYDYLYKRFPSVFSLFDGLILSFEVKSVKPERAIYDRLKNMACSAFDEIIYIDDRQDLIERAKEFNLNCIRFTDYQDLIRSLKEQDLIRPSAQEMVSLRQLKETIGNYKKPLLVGIGNTMRSDDMVGSYLAQGLKDRITLGVYDAGDSLENHLSKIKEYNSDLIIFIDVADYQEQSPWHLVHHTALTDSQLYLTHNSSLKLAIQYLQEQDAIAILILGIKGYRFDIGDTITEEVKRTQCLLKRFFIRNYLKPQELLK